MKLHQDFIIVLIFWSLYVPMSLVLWFETGHKGNWAIILAIGVVIVLLYLITCLIIKKLKSKQEIAEEEPKRILPPESKEDFPLPPLNFDNVFKEDFGVITRDVD